MKLGGLVGPDLSASGGLFRYPQYLVHLHYRAQARFIGLAGRDNTNDKIP